MGKKKLEKSKKEFLKQVEKSARVLSQENIDGLLGYEIKEDTKDTEHYEEIDHPPHYNQGGIETFDYINSNKLGFAAGNAIKYLSRYKVKGTPLKDLLKAQWYLNKLIEEESPEKSKIELAKS